MAESDKYNREQENTRRVYQRRERHRVALIRKRLIALRRENRKLEVAYQAGPISAMGAWCS